MNRPNLLLMRRLATLLLYGSALAHVHASDLKPVAASPSPLADKALILAADRSPAQRLLAVGDHGIVLISDDAGRHYRQARQVPVSTLLTGVAFGSQTRAWAVGHAGTVLASDDAGDTWRIQRMDTQYDRPLFAVHAFSERAAVAVGLWSLVLRTDDGGKTWEEVALPPPPGNRKADLNLTSLFADARGVLYATGERGFLLRSSDQGRHWDYVSTGYNGTLWSGAALADGTLLVGGQRGSLLRSSGGADTAWERIALDSRSSITAIVATGNVVDVVGLDGLYVHSSDGGRSFRALPAPASASLTTAVSNATQGLTLFSTTGPISTVAPKSQ